MTESAAKAANAEHYRKLEHMYLTAPINAFYSPEICISQGEAEITIPVKPDFFHAADAVHGSVYFKLMDDAAFFAVNSLIGDYFALTASFTTYLLRPISEGTMKATGKVVYAGARSFIAESLVVDSEGKEIARGKREFRYKQDQVDGGCGDSGIPGMVALLWCFEGDDPVWEQSRLRWPCQWW